MLLNDLRVLLIEDDLIDRTPLSKRKDVGEIVDFVAFGHRGRERKLRIRQRASPTLGELEALAQLLEGDDTANGFEHRFCPAIDRELRANTWRLVFILDIPSNARRMSDPRSIWSLSDSSVVAIRGSTISSAACARCRSGRHGNEQHIRPLETRLTVE
jgi:hypothetical protein